MPDKPSVHEALAAVKAEVGAVKKAEKNVQQGFNFRGVDSVVNAASPALNKHGVIVVPDIEDYAFDTVEIGRNKTSMGHFILRAKYTFYGPAGDSISCRVISESMDSGDKGAAKAMSVAYRIALLQTLNLPTDEPDPDTESYERSSQAPVAATAVKAPSARKPASAKPAETASAPDLATLVEKAKAAETVEQLRAVWMAVGNGGHMQAKIADPETGEKTDFQTYLYRRSDALSTKSGD